MRRFFLIIVCLLQVFSVRLYAENGSLYDENGSQQEEHAMKIAGVFAKLDKENRYAERLTYADMNVLPLGFKQTISNNEFSIAISSIRFMDSHAEVTLFARMKTAQGENALFFAGQGIKFSYTGNIIGDASLLLVSDLDIPINGHTKLSLKGGGWDTNTGRSSDLTSVTVDCNGFKKLTLTGAISFSKDVLIEVGSDGKPLDKPISVNFHTEVEGWNDMLLEISLPPFQIPGLDGFIFNLRNAIFDFSDSRNSPGIIFPENYTEKYLVSGMPELWRGVYAQELSVTLPKEFSEESKPTSFAAKNLIIDDNGISGIFSAENILPIESGSAGGWAFSIDKFWLGLEAHKITKAGFGGQIGLPVSDTTYLRYDAQILGNNNYQMLVATTDTLDFKFLMSEAFLTPNSYVKLKVEDGKFLPEASLSGALLLKAPLSGGAGSTSGIKMDSIQFRNLCIRTQAPYLSVDYMGYTGEVKLMGFPVSISDIKVTSTNNTFNLGFDLALNLDEKLISASAGFIISSRYENASGRGRWVNDSFKISDLELKNCGISGVFSLSGKLKIMDQDPVYGDGFYGDISLNFEKVLNGFKLGMTSAFGKKDDFRYWFVEGSVTLPTIINVVGPIGIQGFSGGVSNRMKKVVGSGHSKTASDIGYVPNESMGLGLKAGVSIAANGNFMGGDASFEIMFNRHGGVDLIGFYGYVEFMPDDALLGIGGLSKITDQYNKLVAKEAAFLEKHGGIEDALKKLKQTDPKAAAESLTDSPEKVKNAAIAASAGIIYDFSEGSLHANFDVYINTPLIQGSGAGNRAGWAVMHISSDNWYIHVGTPDNRVGVKIGIPGVATVEVDAYFMFGDNLPGSPPPPPEVTRILGENGESFDYMRDLNALASGKGIAFGTSIQVKTGDLQFLILYANFNAGIGFDVMIKDYGTIPCKGRSGPIGINGWFANGQSYAYLSGELGVKVNLWFVKGKFPIIKGGAAALIQTKLPNPTWFTGRMGVNFSLLGGLVKGDMRFKFTLGEECELMIPGSSPIDIVMINDLSPEDGNSDVDVFTAPQLALSMSINSPFDVDMDDGKHTYRISLGKFVVKDGSNTVEGKVEWNKDGTVATFYPHNTLPPKKQLELDVAVTFEEYTNGRWSTVYTSGTLAQETRNFRFTTGDAPDFIPLHNIVYSYPMIEQQYYYLRESSSGFVQLRTGQDYLFPANWKYKVVFMEESGKVGGEVPFTYDERNRRVVFTTPNLSRSKTYQIGIISEPIVEKAQNQGNSMKETVLLEDEENRVVKQGATANKVLNYDGEGKVLLDYGFSTSKYLTFTEKIQSIKTKSNNVVYNDYYIFGLTREILLGEDFEEAELTGTPASGNEILVKATAILDDRYYNEKIYPVVYAEYPVGGSYKLRRDGDEVGVPPVNAFEILTYSSDIFPFTYALPKYYYYDFDEIRTAAANYGIKHPSLAAPYFPDIISGKYKARLQYYLPGGEKGSSEVIFEYEVKK